jgi:dienelactone hydrolase
MVLLHGSDGVHPYHYRWAEWFVAENYVALVVDSLDARGRIGRRSGDLTGERVWDAFAALAYLRSLPFVDAARVGAIGWSGGAGVAMLAGGDLFMTRAPAPGTFGAVVAFYPPCSLSEDIKVPVLFLLGGGDTWTPAERCLQVGRAVRKDSGAAEWVVYPGATHGFDFNRGWWDGSTINVGGHVLRYDARATADAETRIRDFLARYLRRAP